MRLLTIKILSIVMLVLVAVVMLLLRLNRTGATSRADTLADTDLKTNMDHALVLPSFGVVNVMEEHHEALMYWFSAAASGAIKKQGNVLIHIDGHSDAAQPEYWRKMPLFRLPTNQREVKLMMERNDVFIHVAAATGLINRFIWVWPPYDAGGFLHETNAPYVSVRLKIGVMYRYGETDGDRYILERCVCAESDHFTIDNPCAWIDADVENDSEDYVFIPESRCMDMSLKGTVEIVSTDKAIELAKSGRWITASDSVIVDIDEDYYACEAVSAPLYDAGMSKAQIYHISFSVGKLMCVDNAHDEMLADKFFHDLLKITLTQHKLCGSGRAKDDRSCSDSLSMRNTIIDKLHNVLEKARHVMCLPNESTYFILGRLLDDLLYLDERQLEELITVGVCMNQSPRSTGFNRNDGMVLCQGYNGPNTTLIPYHNVDEKEIDHTTNHLKTILSQSFTPGVVTLIRSVRDGYTPRKHFHIIEPKILNVLKTTFPNHINDSSIHYDSELLGGKDGWYLRYKKIKS
ncbi:uncharacterized protein LOC124141198 [Haliotis rufescens]|uniref:uncharacterized protein LOC124141198 n=1 Tax=Haliotis rufescens TaxID=6454 RepID=UPI00201F9DF6|nr:uncharacterized protein LOC124141198 [Haliotis rufescens]